MFTGIIQAVGHISNLVETSGGDARVTVAADGLDLSEAKLGDSIACNGVCLTVVEKSGGSFSVDVSAETFSCTVGFAPGDKINLEMAMRLSDRLGGHLVSGHVDGVGTVLHFAPVAAGEESSWRLDIRAPGFMARYLASKGSVAVNGVSLTVNKVYPQGAGRGGKAAETPAATTTLQGADFSINLIPHTLEQTMLKSLQAGGKVNLEADMLARYADRLMNYVHEQDKD
ncbi:MAG: riboflavin synthase [Pseudomonadota bacterium]|nr:riboflavin synthase [Pseudomonadota bacterium]